ncbi:MAG: molybdopterin-dependent oxidoreductase [Cytophagales bacterium]|nr:molybdopterin-dependent oxidoreductase [Cytophagales bacterium]
MSNITLKRRSFLVGSGALAAGGLALGIPALMPSEAQAQDALGAGAEVNVWVVIKPDDTCVIRIARSEMGQGTRTGLAQLVVEELECDWRKVTTEMPTPGQSLARKRAWGEMSTGGSRGIRISNDYVRRGGAAARIMLLQAAAEQLQVPASELTTASGVITHAKSNRKLRYGQVAAAAAKLAPPNLAAITLKNPKDWQIAGKAMARIDTQEKLNGSLVYGADLRLDGMLCAAIKDCPVFGGKLVSFDENAVKNMRGVKKVVRVETGVISAVAVVADTWWRAKQALAALPIVWDEGANAKVSSSSIAAHLTEGLSANAPLGSLAGRVEGDALGAIAKSAKKVEATYFTPFVSHAAMEPMNATVKLTAGGEGAMKEKIMKAECWVPTQNGEASHAALAEASNLPLAQCEIYKMDLGGGFGRRGGNQDYIFQATEVAKHFVGTPIKLLWSREEDQAHDFYRPIAMAKMAAGLDEQGNLTGLHIRVSGQSINALLSPLNIKNGKDERQLQGLWKTLDGDAQFGYTVPHLLTEYVMRNTHIPVGPWRGVNTNQNAIFAECFIEEVARAAGKDSLEFRRALMKNHPKHLAVLNAAAEKAGWGKPLPAGRFRGISQFMGYASYSAAVAEISLSANNELKVHRIVSATDCGHAVNPDQIAAQIEGGIAYGLSALFFGEMTVENGRMKEQNFDTYRIMRLKEMPKVESVIVPTFDFWGGVGEPTICVAAPAVLNAILAATGKPVRSLPLKNQGFTFA